MSTLLVYVSGGSKQIVLFNANYACILICNPLLIITESRQPIQKGYSCFLTQFHNISHLQVTPLLLGLVREVVETKLVNKTKGHACMLEHVVER